MIQRARMLQDHQLDAALERDGYVVVDDFISPGEVETLLDVFARCQSPMHRLPFGASVLSDDVAYRQAVDREMKQVLRPAAGRLFEGYRHCFSNFVVKAPQPDSASNAGEVPIHQDLTFVDESSYRSLGIWCPLVDSDVGNGCLFVAPGSHNLNHGPRPVRTQHPYGHLDPIFHSTLLKPVPMRAGSVMVFSQKLFHASPPNRSGATRVVAGGLFVPQEAQLYWYYRDPGRPADIDVYEVDDLFYTRHAYATRPAVEKLVATVEYRYDPITPAQLRALARAS